MKSRIIAKTRLSENVYRFRLTAPEIAAVRKAGQFIILKTDAERAERIPLTIADADAQAGTIDVVVQAIGVSTRLLSLMEVGDELADLVGPLGRPTDIPSIPAGDTGVHRAIVVGGGIGVAPAHPIAQALSAAGFKVTAILGARTAELVIMEDEMRRAAQEVIVVTDDGSKGRKALVTAPLTELLDAAKAGGEPVELVVVIGPPVMMKFCALATKPYGVKTIASLNAIMIDGTGMCGGCRVTVGGKTKFVCVDGPEFDAHQVDFDNFIQRLGTYRTEENEHRCRSGIFN